MPEGKGSSQTVSSRIVVCAIKGEEGHRVSSYLGCLNGTLFGYTDTICVDSPGFGEAVVRDLRGSGVVLSSA